MTVRLPIKNTWVLFLLTCGVLKAQYPVLNFFHLDNQQGLSNNSITSIARDSEGFIWIGTQNGLNRYDGYGFTHFYSGTGENALPENHIAHLYVSNSGQLWIGMNSRGVLCYEPVTGSFSAHELTADPENTAALSIQGITEDTDSNLFVASYGGLFYKPRGDPQFKEVAVIDEQYRDDRTEFPGLLSPDIECITAGEEEGVWIAYSDWRITYINLKYNIYQHYSLREFRQEGRQTLISSMFHYRDKLFLGTLGYGLIEFDPPANDYSIMLEEEYLINVNRFYKKEGQKYLWIATANGLINYHLPGSEYQIFMNDLDDASSLSSSSTTTVYEGDNDLLWVGTTNAGLNYSFLNKPFRHIHVKPGGYHSLTDEDVTAILHDRGGNLWIGYTSGVVECHHSGRKMRLTIPVESLTDSDTPGEIFSLFEDSEGDIYCASWQGGLQKYNSQSGRFNPVTGSAASYLRLFDGIDIRAVDEDARGNLWLSVHGKGVSVFDKHSSIVARYTSAGEPEASITNDWVYDLCVDEQGNVWVGSAWGLSRISPGENIIRQYYSSSDTLSLNDSPAYLTARDNQDNIWIGTDNGLNLYDPANDHFHRFGKSAGLPVTQVRGLEQDSDGTYWISTTNGLISFVLDRSDPSRPELKKIRHFDKNDGLLSATFHSSSASQDARGNLYFGGKKGIDYFDPQSIGQSAYAPPLRILNIELFGKQVYPGAPGGPETDGKGTILLNHRQNMLGVEFTSLNYFNNRGNVYQYKLSPLNDQWIQTGNSRDLVFSNLDPGRYSLSLRAMSKQGITSEATNILRFHIKPPFWKTDWFLVLISSLLIALLITFIRLYTTQQRRKNARLARLVKKRTGELHKINEVLTSRTAELQESNALLEERQEKIKEQSEELLAQSEELAKTNEDLNRTNKMKDKFFSIISHDLKNPFNTIIGFSNLLINNYETFTDEKRQEMLGFVHDAVNSAYALLENLLHWSRAQTNRLKINPQPLPVQEIFETNQEIVRPMLQKKNHSFSADIDREMVVIADREMVNTVIRNLINNACKFTPEGGEISFLARRDGEQQACIEIKDTGTGMDKNEIDDLFRIDVSHSKKGTSGEQGTGLGMILCREFVEKMGGRIWIESEAGLGTSVFFTLPLQQE